MRRFVPQTLPVWVLAIVIAGLLIIQVTTLVLVARDRNSANEVVDYYRLNDRVYATVQLMHAEAPDARAALASGLAHSGYGVTVSAAPAVSNSIAGNDQLAELEDILVARLAKFGILDARVRRDPGRQPRPAQDGSDSGSDVGDVEADLLQVATGFAASDKLTASVQFSDGQWLNLIQPITPPVPVLTLESLPLYAVAAGLVLLAAAWAIRRLTAPYRVMESAVRRLGDDIKSPPLPETGSREIRAAARALNVMQRKLRDYVEGREQLAAALAHDLRTPMTRMRIRLSLLRGSRLREELAADLADIEAIASSVIDFATFEVSDEKPERIDFRSLVEAVADGFGAASLASAPGQGRALVCVARPVALKRCVTNLVQNAVKYGKKAQLSLRGSGDRILLTISDEGPGIPPAQLDAVFAPFVRIDGSRSRETGGHGLGLAIARNIARDAGGDITLANRPRGGLEATLTLPLAA